MPSLQPRATARLWNRLVHRPHTRAARTATADCRPLRAVFYTATDWLRLATKLAAANVPCADYYISIPPLAADKTAFRPDQPWRIRALGSNFHVLAEISTSGWQTWVAANGGSWYAAGVEARRRMAAAGFDVASGDSWIVNELSSAVVTNTGNARANTRELVRGLYEGDGGPAVKGGVFVYGIGQGTAVLSTWKAYLEDWYRDSAFWNDMSRYVSDWSQELYGDVRTYAVGGASIDDRRAALDAYLQHELTLASAGPGEVASARTFLQSAYSPLANAAWQYASSFGWTAVPYDQMEDYVTAQADALRSFAVRNGESVDHFGFAWAPRSPAGMSSTDFANQSGAIADRLAAALHDSAASGDGACVPSWCSTTLGGAAFNQAWGTFATWSPDALALGGQTSTTAGAALPVTAQLQVAGIAWPESSPVTVTLSSSSPGGSFSSSADGPWTPTLNAVVAAGATSVNAFYRDTSAGTATLGVNAANRVGAALTVQVAAAALATLAVSPASVNVAPGGSQQFSAAGADAFGNAVAVSPSWSVGAGTPGTISASGLFAAAAGASGPGTVVATAGGLTASASLVVTAASLRAQTIAFAALAPGTYGDPDFRVSAVASSGLPVSFAASGACTGNGDLVHVAGAGSCTVTASQPGDATFAAAPSVSQTFAIAKATQTISFTPLTKQRVGRPDVALRASASSGLAVSFAARGACTLKRGRVHLVRAGSCTVTVSQAGDANHEPAPSVSRTFAIAKAYTCVVPKLVGSTLASATRLLKQRHCTTGRTRLAYSAKLKKGHVLAQGVRPGRVLKANANVSLTVSRGRRR